MLKKLFAALLCLLLLPAALAEESAPILELHQMKLGSADGYYLRVGDIEIMIDGGNAIPKKKSTEVVDCLRALGADKLDAYIITHWHLDHCQNVNSILAEFGDAATMVYSPSAEVPAEVTGDSDNSVTVQIAPLANGIYQQMVMGDVIQLGDLTITCIGPKEVNYAGTQNRDSLNFIIQYGTRRYLFTGDFAQSGQINNEFKELCSNVDVFKFPHHGIETYEGSGEFEIGKKAAGVVAPTYVLVPSGFNNYRFWVFFGSAGVNVVRENILTNSADHVVILTDGGDYLEARIEQNPADYAPKTN